MGPPGFPVSRPSRLRTAANIVGRVVFVAIPLVSFGYLTGFAFAYAAVRLRSRWTAAAAAGYLAVTAAICGFSQDTGEPPDALLAGFVVTMLIGTVHAALLQRLFRPHEEPSTVMDDPAVAAAIARRQRRTEARQLLARDPALADELAIGRPDLPRQFDDGGLVDVNHVPVSVLGRLPGLGPDHAERILAARERQAGLTCVEDLVVFADVPGETAESLRDVLLFRRPAP